MKNLLRTCLLVAGLAPLLVVAPPAAEAHEGVCVVGFGMTLSTGLGLPLLTVNSATFRMSGICTNGSTMSLTGTLTGACNWAVGSGTANGHHSFTLTWNGAMVLTGSVNGVLQPIEDPTDSGSCTNKTAVNFVVAGTVTM